jgi:hypothetical protein
MPRAILWRVGRKPEAHTFTANAVKQANRQLTEQVRRPDRGAAAWLWQS